MKKAVLAGIGVLSAVVSVCGQEAMTPPDAPCTIPQPRSSYLAGTTSLPAALLKYAAEKHGGTYLSAITTPDETIQVEDRPAYTCSGTAYYVSPDGDDSNGGLSAGDEWATISKVNSSMSSFSAGDCILFKRGGTWKGTQLFITKSGSSGAPIVFGSYGTASAKPIISGAGLDLNSNHGLIRGNGVSHITLDGLRVVDVGLGDADRNGGIGFYRGSNLIVQNCEAYNTEGPGIKFNSSSNVTINYNEVSKACQNSNEESISIAVVDTFEVKNNTVSDGGTAAGGGAGIDAKDGSHDGTIHHNEVYGINGANGIYVDGYATDTYNIEVYSNYVHDTEGVGIQIGAESSGNLYNISIHHNLVHHALRGAFAMHDKAHKATDGTVRQVYVYNNTFHRNGTPRVAQYGGIRISDSLIETGGLLINNNIIADNANFQVGIRASSDIPATAYTVVSNLILGVNANAGGFTAVGNETD